MKKLLAAFFMALIVISVCISFGGCESGADDEKQAIQYGTEYNYTYQDERKTIIMGTETEPQRTATIITTFSTSYIFYNDGTYKLTENTVEREQGKEADRNQTTINGYGTFVILSDNYLYLTQYSYNDKILSVLVTQRFKIENESTFISDTEIPHTFSIN